MSDVGLTHVALAVANIDASVGVYEPYAGMQVVHRRDDPGGSTVAWLRDLTRPFQGLIEVDEVERRLGGASGHLAIAAARADVDHLRASAAAAGQQVVGPADSGPPLGYGGYLVDPDGHNPELSYGQEVGSTVDRAAR